jgi:hypothetical protein
MYYFSIIKECSVSARYMSSSIMERINFKATLNPHLW